MLQDIVVRIDDGNHKGLAKAVKCPYSVQDISFGLGQILTRRLARAGTQQWCADTRREYRSQAGAWIAGEITEPVNRQTRAHLDSVTQ